MEKITLYGKQGEKVRVWSTWTEGAVVVVEHGQQGGKLTQKRYTAEPKNQNRANATNAKEQAVLEAEAKVVKQLKSGYSHTIEEALAWEPFEPMKALNFNDHEKKVVYPCIVQPKTDGMRLMIDKDGNAWSKQGEPLELPKHWRGVKELAIKTSGLDGELYCGLKNSGGLALQEIISAFRKPNKNTERLQYWVYDIPNSEMNQYLRYDVLNNAVLNSAGVNAIVLSSGEVVSTAAEANMVYNKFVSDGYEGCVYRNLDGKYEFGKRSSGLIKRKPRLDGESIVVSVTQDKNGDGVLLCQAINGKQSGVQFECLMRKDADPVVNYRKYSNALLLIGKAITYQYEDIGEDTENGRGKPQKPVAVALREMLGTEGRY